MSKLNQHEITLTNNLKTKQDILRFEYQIEMRKKHEKACSKTGILRDRLKKVQGRGKDGRHNLNTRASSKSLIINLSIIVFECLTPSQP